MILENLDLDDVDRNFSKHSLLTYRLDLQSEFDAVWQRKYDGMSAIAAPLIRDRERCSALRAGPWSPCLPATARACAA